MPTFEFTSPEGKTYQVDGPEGATQEQAWGMLQGHLGDQKAPENPIAPYTGSHTLGEKISNFVKNVVSNPPPTVAGMADAVKSARQNSMDVAKGEATPEQVMQLHGAAALGLPAAEAPLARAGRAAVPAATDQIKGAAKSAYDVIREEGRSRPIDPQFAKIISDDLKKSVSQTAARPESGLANSTYSAIDDIAKQKDLGGLYEIRERLGEIKRGAPGREGEAARIAINHLDAETANLHPGNLTAALHAADKNYAIASDVAKLEQRVKDAQMGNTQSGGRIEGNRIRAAVMPMLKRGGAERLEGLGEGNVAAAAQRVTNPGMLARGLQIGGAFDPTHSNLALLGHGLGYLMSPHALAAAPFGFGARAGYDALMRARAAAVSQALRAHAPASMAQPRIAPQPMRGANIQSLLGTSIAAEMAKAQQAAGGILGQ